ncbi:XrtY-associated glycosyltransferase XYAG1 [Mucilaginibacter sp. E4BP6]|uniref:XrtY-associated glycosyltransferase XYAG1 n=1 Tax=Mucilaginibacter sp. E4BP6 TaxID=2723089 RepID=UPI0015CC6D84|nr:glycosyltransferase [Mucilaginibacter sp. E4BP6]NYE67562.1 glycosyltransferase involved in cell wall biosynthesis [Mucilaginibacter sp. E4BP6]
MKILQLSPSYKPAYIYGGPTMSISMLSEQLVAAGKGVTVYATTANGLTELPVEIAKPVLVDGVQVIYFKRVTKDHTHLSPSLLTHLWRTARDYDVIHIHAWWNLVSVLGCFVALIRKVPVIVSPRGTLSNYSFQNKNNNIKSQMHSWLGKPLLKNCFIHTTSNHERDVLKAMLPGNTIFNIPNFINLVKNKFSGYQPTDHLRLIFFSRIEEKKGLDVLLDALKSVSIPYKLTIAGDGNSEYVSQLKKMALDNGVAAQIDWIGFQTDNKYQLLYDHDVMILPSYDENFGNVVIESLSVGTPVLVSKAVGLADYVDQNRLGWLCETNPASVSAAINNLASQKAGIIRIKEYAPGKISADFNYANLAKRYIDMYTQVIK